MTIDRDTVIALAREAGGETDWVTRQTRNDPELADDDIVFCAQDLERFAQAIAQRVEAAERARFASMAKAFKDQGYNYTGDLELHEAIASGFDSGPQGAAPAEGFHNCRVSQSHEVGVLVTGAEPSPASNADGVRGSIGRALHWIDADLRGMAGDDEFQRSVDQLEAILREGLEKVAEQQRALLPSQPLRSPECWCECCDTVANSGWRSRMSLCPKCGDKRCPRAQHHDRDCSVP